MEIKIFPHKKVVGRRSGLNFKYINNNNKLRIFISKTSKKVTRRAQLPEIATQSRQFMEPVLRHAREFRAESSPVSSLAQQLQA